MYFLCVSSSNYTVIVYMLFFTFSCLILRNFLDIFSFSKFTFCLKLHIWVAKAIYLQAQIRNCKRSVMYLQNPQDCKAAKKLSCNMGKGCGYGCQLHHLVYCFVVAYGTQRTLLIESRGWRYASGGWETVFLPVSDTCTAVSGSRSPWSSEYW